MPDTIVLTPKIKN